MTCDYLPLMTKVLSGLLALAGTFYLGHRHGRQARFTTAKARRTPRKKTK